MTTEAKPDDKPAAAAVAKPASSEDKALQAKKKEYRELKQKYNKLRESAKAISAERKEIGEKLTVMAPEVGVEFKIRGPRSSK
jgi:hypothetical protein